MWNVIKIMATLVSIGTLCVVISVNYLGLDLNIPKLYEIEQPYSPPPPYEEVQEEAGSEWNEYTEEEYRELNKDGVKAIDRAKMTTSEYCSPEIWVEWNPEEASSNTVGQTLYDAEVWRANDGSITGILYTDLMISPELDGNITASTDTAWHECAHAKTQTISPELVDELIEEVKREFSQGEHSIHEQLADAMATVMTGSTAHNYYKDDFTQSQLEIAEKIWNASPIVEKETVYSEKVYLKVNEII